MTVASNWTSLLNKSNKKICVKSPFDEFCQDEWWKTVFQFHSKNANNGKASTKCRNRVYKTRISHREPQRAKWNGIKEEDNKEITHSDNGYDDATNLQHISMDQDSMIQETWCECLTKEWNPCRWNIENNAKQRKSADEQPSEVI